MKALSYPYLLLSFLLFTTGMPSAGGQQIDIPRISGMPDFPQPYQMRNWKQLANGYDSLVFDIRQQGEFLPLVFFRQQSVNYPQQPSFGLHTAVGTLFPGSGEAINVIPAVVGASLVGIDKSEQFGQNWVQMVAEYFNRRPQENIYLNHPVTNSGDDWWYETMPNIFFMQLKYLYPDVAVFDEQLPLMARQWINALEVMGASDTPWTVPYMNYRAFSMSRMQPLDQGVPQPEAAGAIGWILYLAYIDTGNEDYRKAAEWAMEFLDQWQQNPSYELQLPYGVYTAARMNAELGTDYNLEKMLNWTFERGPLRGWGAISGNWGGYDVHGLIGEANDAGNDYAFLMNGFQQAAALVPMLRYDPRFARDVAKWLLNLANASRFFYSAFLPANMQDNAQWAFTYDPQAYIGYEALREVKYGISPYMTGDAMAGGWALTNLMLYGSSHVGYLAALMDTTEVEGILQLDLLKTDFFHQPAFPSFLYYNPHETDHQVILSLNEGSYRIYDVISKQILHEDQSGETIIRIPASGVVMPVVIPQQTRITYQGKRTLAGDVIIDFDNGQPAGALSPRIKALAAADSMLLPGGMTNVYCTAAGDQEIMYTWYLNGSSFVSEDQIEFQAPEQEGSYTIACMISNPEGLSDSLSITIRVVSKIPAAPLLHSLTADPRKLRPHEQSNLICLAEDPNGQSLEYQWTVQAGLIEPEEEIALYTAPEHAGNYYVNCRVINPDQLWTYDSILLMVRNFPDQGEGNIIGFYPFHGDAKDHSGNDLHGTPGGGLSYTVDMNEQPAHAAYFNGTSSYVLLPASEAFDFSEAFSISFFLQMDEATSGEQHPISHGSWQHRYKISISGGYLRFTINTREGVRDLDSETPLQAGEWYHVAAIYNGQDIEIWLNGKLDAFVTHTGLLNFSPYQLVLGQNLPGNNEYNFKGSLSRLYIFDYALSPLQIIENISVDNQPVATGPGKLQVFPNPVISSTMYVRRIGYSNSIAFYQVLDLHGKVLDRGYFPAAETSPAIHLSPSLPQGYYILRIIDARNAWSFPFLLLR